MTGGEPVWVGLDVGGTKVAGGLVDSRGQVCHRVELPTRAEAGFPVSSGQVVVAARTLLGWARARGWTVGGAGAGFPGPLDPVAGVLHNPPNLPEWDAVCVGDLLADALGMPVTVDNDANVAALGEARQGAGREFSLVVYFTLGTGVGGGVVWGGRIFPGVRGAAAELGHVVVQAGGEPCRCGGRGCLEAYASGPALVRRLRAALAGAAAAEARADAPGFGPGAQGGGRAAEAVPGSGVQGGGRAAEAVPGSGVQEMAGAEQAVEAVRLGHPVAVRVWEETMEYLAAGVVSAVHAFNPDVVVIGGGLASAGELLFAPLRRLVRDRGMPYLVEGLEIRPAALGRDAGIVGAALLARDQAEGARMRW